MSNKVILNGGKPLVKATRQSAGYDVYPISNHIVNPKETVLVRTGISLELHEGVFGMLSLRSSAAKLGLIMPIGVGVIDSDYRGEVLIPVTNISDKSVGFGPNVSIAQIVILSHGVFSQGVTLIDNERTGGFGSTNNEKH